MATIINADTSDGLKLTSDTSGEIQFQSGGTTIATVDSTGITMASGKLLASTGPAFSAYASADQTLSNAIWTKVAIDTELFDTNSNYDTSNYRFTPTVAGYYQVNNSFRTVGSALLTRVSAIYKNGVQDSALNVNRDTSASAIVYSSSNLIYMNGSTDYLELFVLVGFSSGTATLDFFNTTNTSYFSAFLARAA
jgi:hypothetical protein